MRQLASLEEIVGASRGKGTRTPEQQLEALISLFCDAARAVDPTITKMWVGRGGEGLNQPYFISMERDEGASCVMRVKQ